MLVFLGVILIGIAIGLATGGSVQGVARLRLRWWPLAIGGLVLQLVPVGSKWIGSALIALSFVLLFVFLGANIRLPGIPAVAAGIALNALAIAANAGMPVSQAALRSALGTSGDYGRTLERLVRAGPPKHHLAGEDTVLRPLTDVVGIGPPVSQVYSAGDFVAMAGMVWVLAAATRTEIVEREQEEEEETGDESLSG